MSLVALSQVMQTTIIVSIRRVRHRGPLAAFEALEKRRKCENLVGNGVFYLGGSVPAPLLSCVPRINRFQEHFPTR